MVVTELVYIDDEVELTEIFSELLEGTHYKVTTFNDEHLAIQYCNETIPFLAFIDFRLHSMMGDEVALKLPPNTKTILVSGDLEPETNFKFDGFIAKPFKLAKILETLDNLEQSN